LYAGLHVPAGAGQDKAAGRRDAWLPRAVSGSRRLPSPNRQGGWAAGTLPWDSAEFAKGCAGYLHLVCGLRVSYMHT